MNSDPVAEFLLDLRTHRADLFPIVEQLRTMILASGPIITTQVKYGGLLFASRDDFCGIFPYTTHVTLEFSQGASLPDPDARLCGKGKYRRHLKINSLLDIQDKQAAWYIALARQAADA